MVRTGRRSDPRLPRRLLRLQRLFARCCRARLRCFRHPHSLVSLFLLDRELLLSLMNHLFAPSPSGVL